MRKTIQSFEKISLDYENMSYSNLEFRNLVNECNLLKDNSAENLTSEKSFRNDEEDENICNFCPKLSNFKKSSQMLSHALASKFNVISEKTQFESAEVIDFVQNSSIPTVINFKDEILFEENDEYLSGFYSKKEYKRKIEFLLEYYKYHCDIPRYFNSPLCSITNWYYNKCRKIMYYQVKKMMQNGKLLSHKTSHITSLYSSTGVSSKSRQKLLINVKGQQQKKNTRIITTTLLEESYKFVSNKIDMMEENLFHESYNKVINFYIFFFF